jgi:hypothetical protein
MEMKDVKGKHKWQNVCIKLANFLQQFTRYSRRMHTCLVSHLLGLPPKEV